MEKSLKFKPFFTKLLSRILLLALVLSYPQISSADQSSELYNQPYLKLISRPAAISAGQSPAVVAIIDDGVDASHPDLQNNFWTNDQGLRGWNFLRNSADLTPQGGHGTEVAGIIQEVAGPSNVKFMTLIVCNQTSGCDKSAIIQAIYYAADNGATVINLSFGLVGQNNFSDEFNQAIAYAYSRNVVIVAAAGNGESNSGVGQNLSLSPISPVCNDNSQNMIFGVSSVSGNGNIPSWANYGQCVDAAALGENIFTTTNPDFYYGQLYGYFSGTSYSAAEVSGLAALVKSQYPALTPGQITDLIISNSKNNPGYQNQFGGGLIDVQKTLQAAKNLFLKNQPPAKKTTSTKNKNVGLDASVKNQPAKANNVIHPRGL